MLFGPSEATDTLFTCFPATLTTDKKELLLKCRVALRLGMSILEQGTEECLAGWQPQPYVGTPFVGLER